MHVLALNSGSSSLKFAVYDIPCATTDAPVLHHAGAIENIGSARSRMRIGTGAAAHATTRHLPDRGAAYDWLVQELDGAGWLARLDAIGHRVVHGGATYCAPVRVTPAVRAALERLVPLAPEHLPDELRAMDIMARLAPALPQVACFDTAFHRDMPREARWYGLPRALAEDGMVRYGFHGLSYEYVVRELRGRHALGARTIVAHLGNGASMAALRDGRSIDTSMGLTPLGGFVMSTRSGDLDPGMLLYLLRERSLSHDAVRAMVTTEGGLLGLSATSADMRQLLDQCATDVRAAEAIAIFCYQVRKFLGAYVAALGGLDTLAFTGGIGENAPAIRARICAGLECIGIHLDPVANDANAGMISTRGAPVATHVVRTNEERMIAHHTARALRPATGP